MLCSFYFLSFFVAFILVKNKGTRERHLLRRPHRPSGTRARPSNSVLRIPEGQLFRPLHCTTL